MKALTAGTTSLSFQLEKLLDNVHYVLSTVPETAREVEHVAQQLQE